MQLQLLFLGICVLIALLGAWQIVTSGSLAGWTSLAAGIFGAAWFRARLRESREELRPMRSLVLLLGRPRSLEAADLAGILGRVWDLPLQARAGAKPEQPADHTVVGQAPLFIVTLPREGVFLVSNHDCPYASAEGEPALPAHRAWLSIDHLGTGAPVDHRAVERRISPALGALADETVVALYQPLESRLLTWSSSVQKRLRDGAVWEDVFGQA